MRKDDENSGSNCAQPDSSPVDRHDDRRTTVLGQMITPLGEPTKVNLVAFHQPTVTYGNSSSVDGGYGTVAGTLSNASACNFAAT